MGQKQRKKQKTTEGEEKTEGGFPLGRQMKGWRRMTATSDSQPVNDGQGDGGGGGGERAPNPRSHLTRITPSRGNFTTFRVLSIS